MGTLGDIRVSRPELRLRQPSVESTRSESYTPKQTGWAPLTQRCKIGWEIGQTTFETQTCNCVSPFCYSPSENILRHIALIFRNDPERNCVWFSLSIVYKYTLQTSEKLCFIPKVSNVQLTGARKRHDESFQNIVRWAVHWHHLDKPLPTTTWERLCKSMTL